MDLGLKGKRSPSPAAARASAAPSPRASPPKAPTSSICARNADEVDGGRRVAEGQGRQGLRPGARRRRRAGADGLDRRERRRAGRHRRAGLQRQRARGRRYGRELGEIVPHRHDAHRQRRRGGRAVPREVAARLDRADLQRLGLRGRFRRRLLRRHQGGADPLRQGPEPPARRQGHPRQLRVARQHLLRRRHLAEHREEHARSVRLDAQGQPDRQVRHRRGSGQRRRLHLEPDGQPHLRAPTW